MENTINRAAVQRMILARLEVIRPALHGKLTRVSGDSLNWLESRLQNIIDSELRIHPSRGKTIQLGSR